MQRVSKLKVHKLDSRYSILLETANNFANSVVICFQILEGQFDKLCHQCCNVEDHNEVFHHYNFKVKTREPDSADWTVRLYFAEVKEIFGRKYYFCWPLEPNEDGINSCLMKQSLKYM
jgi:hypothetical protein